MIPELQERKNKSQEGEKEMAAEARNPFENVCGSVCCDYRWLIKEILLACSRAIGS